MKHAFQSLIVLAALGLSHVSANPDLDGATGHIFKFDAEKKTFELLKETEYDPKTETARSRFTVHWTDGTKVSKVTELTSFEGLKEPLTASCEGMDDKNLKAAISGKPFVAAIVNLYSGVEAPPLQLLAHEPQLIDKLSSAVKAPITGFFIPKADGKSGMIEIDGRNLSVTMRKQNSRIFLHEKLTAADLAKGFWQTTIRGGETDGRFVIRSMTATPLPDPLATDDPKLPRVLIIGDSISMNYFDAAKAELKGVANIHRNEGNAGPSTRGVLNAELWLGDYTEKGRHWDVIQFNHGLHDLKQVYDKKSDTFGAYSVPMEDYKANLGKEIAILKKTGAKLIWCATTPVPNDNKSEYARRKGACVDFNKAAMEVMAKHPEIRINDLHATVTNSPVFDNWRKTIDVHFYQKEECQALGKAVADAVRAALAE